MRTTAFVLLCAATGDAATGDASPPSRRLAGEAMERVRRNCLTLTERLRAMEYPCEEASLDHPRSLGYMVPRTHDSSDAAVQRDLNTLTAKLEAFRDEGRIDQAQLEDLAISKGQADLTETALISYEVEKVGNKVSSYSWV